MFVDADVLYSATVRYWLFQLRVSTPSMFQLHTSEDVLAEVIAKLRDNNPRWDGRQTVRIREDILEIVDEVLTDFDGSVPYEGSDPNDFHVHAAAIGCRADILLTCDTGLLRQPNADDLSYEAYHPDDFFVLLNDSAPLDVRQATYDQMIYSVRTHGARKSRMVQSLQDAGCPEFAKVVNRHLQDLAGALPRGDRRRLRRSEGLDLAGPEA